MQKRHIYTIAFWLLASTAVLMLMTIALYNLNFNRRIEAHAGHVSSGYRRTSFYSGQNRLTGYIFGENNDQGLIVISHGLGGGGLSYLREITFFLNNGWRVFTFDKTGSHNSEGNGARGLPQSAIDLNAALDYIVSQNWDIPVMLFGHSWGGYAVTAVLNFDHEINAVVSLAGYAEPLMMLQEAAGAMIGRLSYLTAPFLWAYNQFLFGEHARLCAVEGINRSEIPVKIIHGRSDDVVLYDGAGIIAQRERISNPNALFVSRYYPDRSGHNDMTLDSSLMIAIHEFFMEGLLI